MGSHQNRFSIVRGVVLSCVIAGLAAGQARGLNILTVGDSITYGYNVSGYSTPASPGTTQNVYGYQTTLSQLLGPGFNFVGEYKGFDGFTGFPWNGGPDNPALYQDAYNGYHYGLPGATMQNLTANLQNVATAPTTPAETSSPGYHLTGQTLGQRLTGGNKPDVVILQIGTNNLSSASNAASLSASDITTLKSYYRDVLTQVATQFDDANIMVSLIIPKSNYYWTGFQFTNMNIRNNVAAFNNLVILSLLNDIATNAADPLHDTLEGRIATVDLFKIDLSILSPALQAAAQNDGDQYVDWVKNDDESLLTSSNGSSLLINQALMSDYVHPNATGYQIMGYAMYNGLYEAGFLAVPEPGSLALLAGGALLLARRRIRR